MSETIELLFPYFTGNQLDPSWFRRNPWRKVFEKADIPQIRIHDMRHTFASLLLQEGESLHYVKEQLGHTSIQTTVDVCRISRRGDGVVISVGVNAATRCNGAAFRRSCCNRAASCLAYCNPRNPLTCTFDKGQIP